MLTESTIQASTNEWILQLLLYQNKRNCSVSLTIGVWIWGLGIRIHLRLRLCGLKPSII
jgi:hypothetical protein